MKHFLRQIGEWFCVRFYFGDPAAQTAQSQQQHQQQAQQYAQQQQQAAMAALQQYLQQNKNPAMGWGGIQGPPGAGMAGGMTTGMPGGQGMGNVNLAQMLGGMMQQAPQQQTMQQQWGRPGMPQAGLPQTRPQGPPLTNSPMQQRMMPL